MKIFVSGIGLVSALGDSVQESMGKIYSNQSGIKENFIINGLETELPAGSFEMSNDQIKALFKIEKKKLIPRCALLGMIAGRQITDTCGIVGRTGFINGTTTGGMDLSEQYFHAEHQETGSGNIQQLKTHDLSSVTHLIGDFINVPGYRNTISTACSSSANAIMLGARMIEQGLLDQVLVGGCDALTNFTIQGFKSLQIYDKQLCRPFDNERKGLNLGEGAGYILLENQESLKLSGNSPIAQITGWANANDAFHQTGTSEEGIGAHLAMSTALKKANLNVSEIDYLNAHGTATERNDSSELSAILQVFESVDYSSTKGATGHTLGAAGGIESVLSLCALKEQKLLPNINWENTMDGYLLQPNLAIKEKAIRHVMSNSLGFGGNSTSLIFSAL